MIIANSFRFLTPILVMVVASGLCASVGAEEKVIANVNITFDEPAYAGLPVWVHIGQDNIRYPYGLSPTFIAMRDFQVTRDGILLEQRKLGPMIHSGPPDGSCAPLTSPKGRIPLHVLFDLTKPGTYKVKYQSYDDNFLKPSVNAASDWVILELKAPSPEQITAFLDEKIANPPEDVGLLVGDYLPSLMALRDERAIPIFAKYVYHPDRIVQYFALAGLKLFGEDRFGQEIKQLIKETGPTPVIADQYQVLKHLSATEAKELIESSFRNLNSNSPILLEGELRFLGFLRGSTWFADPKVYQEIDQAVWAAVPHIRSFQERGVVWQLTLFAGVVKSDKSRNLLWELVNVVNVGEQALICLCWIGDSRDLPKLAKFLNTDSGSLAYQLKRAYGKQAVPYLTAAMKFALLMKTRLWCAKELLDQDSVEAYKLFQSVIEKNLPEKALAMQILRDNVAKDNAADEKKLLAMVKCKIQSIQAANHPK